jgi:hypothetical protein
LLGGGSTFEGSLLDDLAKSPRFPGVSIAPKSRVNFNRFRIQQDHLAPGGGGLGRGAPMTLGESLNYLIKLNEEKGSY